MTEKNVRISIPEKIRAQLWVAAAGRCEFRGCNKPLDRNVLTQQRLFVGQHAHIIGDSVHGPRGNETLSKALAHDVSNLMLTCRACHWTIDQLEADYSVQLLREMKRSHEARIQDLYDIVDSKESVPVVLRHPIKRVHVPEFSDIDVQAATMANSKGTLLPSARRISLDYRGRVTREQDPLYWQELVRQLKDDYSSQMSLAKIAGTVEHLSIFVFAPMPLNMQLGAFIGNKVPASVYQWDRIRESWKWPNPRQFGPADPLFDNVPLSEGRDLAVKLCFSGEISAEAVQAAVPGLPVVRFGLANPSPLFVEDEQDIQRFRTRFGEFMAAVRNRGYRRIHLFPAMPLSLSVEVGRQLLPKADPIVEVWDFHNDAFVHTLQLQM